VPVAEHEVAHAPRARTVQRGGGFPVEADDLLMVGDDAVFWIVSP